MEDFDVAEFVVCPSCGARIKAGREFCLRCFEPLPTADRPIRPPIWVSFGLSNQTRLIVLGAVGVLVVALIAVIVITEPKPINDDPVPLSQPATRPAAPSGAPDSSAPVDPNAAAAPVAVAAPATENVSPPDQKLLDRRAMLEAKLARSPNDADALNGLGQVLQELGQPEDAFRAFDAAVQAQPRRLDFRMNLAINARELGRWDRAIDEFREATRIQPRDYVAQFSLADALQKKGDDQTAIVEFEKARKLGPSAPGVPLGLAASYEKVGRTSDAVREYELFLQLQPNSADTARVRERLTRLAKGRS